MSNTETSQITTNVEEVEETTTSVQETTATTQSSLKVQDRLVGVPLSTVIATRNVIEVLTQRGNVFKANELTAVGSLFDTFTTIINKSVETIRNEVSSTEEANTEATAETSE